MLWFGGVAYACLVLIASQVSSQFGYQTILLLLNCYFECVLCRFNRFLVLACFRVHGGEHLKNCRLLPSGETGGRFKLR